MKAAHSIYDDLQKALDKTEQLTLLNPDSLIQLDVSAHRADVNVLLLRASELCVMSPDKHLRIQKNSEKHLVHVEILWVRSLEKLISEERI